ncbi:hypothetical protein JL720_8846 [Aureococcus anophagefferens]|nr:hypothetical protein JL720_8846 [Aureococcus anophagefferens]
MALRLLALLAAARGAWRPQEELARLHGASFAAGDAWRRVELELDRSLRAYDAVPSADAAASRAAEIFARDASFFAVVENTLYVSDAHDSKIKHKPHYLFSTILSMLRREPFPNFVATWDVAATGAHCRRVGRRVPCLAIAKQGGFNQAGVLIPNPYFAHVDEWDARVATWRAAIPAWDDRDPRLFWRGSVRSARTTASRVAALTLTAQHPDRYDVRVTHGLDAPDAKACAREFPYTKAMRFRLGDVADDAGGAAAAVALAGVDCGALRRVYWHSPDRPFFDETPGLGKPVAYAALDDGDPPGGVPPREEEDTVVSGHAAV